MKTNVGSIDRVLRVLLGLGLLVAAGQALTLTTEEALQGHGFADPNAVCTWPHFSHKMPLSLCYLSARRDDPAITALRETTLALWNESA